MPVLKVVLLPFAWVFHGITSVRNYLYDIGHKRSFQFETMVISVGNLNAGGSGKTPMIEYLVRLLQDRFALAILSRGYGRKSRGFRAAGLSDDAKTLGDEPFQYYRKFGEKVKVTVGEERALAIPTLLNEFPATEVTLLDDAFQHRSVVPQLSVLLTAYQKPFYEDFLLPYGRLREGRSGSRRADVVVVTKCTSSITNEEMSVISGKIRKYAGEKPVFFSSVAYKTPMGFASDSPIDKRIILVSGIANNRLLADYLSEKFEVAAHFPFRDHHVYTKAELIEIQDRARQLKVSSILTTEKDMARLISPDIAAHLEKKMWYYLPIEIAFIKNGANFDETVLQSIEQHAQAPRTTAQGL